jgi:oligopeptide/dipeptide ABC transporter ATP-binding protein
MSGQAPYREAGRALLSVRDLDVRFGAGDRETIVLDRVSLDIAAGEVFGLIGETGAGKSLTAWAALDLLPRGARRAGGDIHFNGAALGRMTARRMRQIRGGEIGVVVQNPIGALDPTRRVGHQVAGALRSHSRVARREAWARAVESLRSVGIPDPERRASAWPHELSGGMAQRVLIAMALINGPRLVIADEPTTGLDVTIQAEILDLLAELVRKAGTAIWIITHDLGVIANFAERAGVMFAGEVVETAMTGELFANPRHPYTIDLLDLQSDALEARGAERNRAPPNLTHRPLGCQFQFRCPWTEEVCLTARPKLLEVVAGHGVRCFVAQRLAAAAGEAAFHG